MVPATPSNIGVFQLAVISVLHTGFGVSTADALAYGVILQAVEIATAVALGLPALVREGLTWSDLRVQALPTAPVRLEPKPRARPGTSSRSRICRAGSSAKKLCCIHLACAEACRHHSQAGTPAREGVRPAPFHPSGAWPAFSDVFIAGSTRFLDGSTVMCIESSNRPTTHANWGKGSP